MTEIKYASKMVAGIQNEKFKLQLVIWRDNVVYILNFMLNIQQAQILILINNSLFYRSHNREEPFIVYFTIT